MTLQVAIDGPAGAGKSTVAKAVAEACGLTLVDTGAIYRTLALAAAREGVAPDDEAELAHLAEGLNVHFEMQRGNNRVFLDSHSLMLNVQEKSKVDLGKKIVALAAPADVVPLAPDAAPAVMSTASP